MSERKPTSHLLYNGGTVYINQAGSHWSIDVFGYGPETDDDLIYHAYYASEDEAREDFDSWKRWDA